MERVRDLIHKLGAQEGAGEAPAVLLATVRELAAELDALLPRTAVPQGGRVAVLLPAGFVARPPAASPAGPHSPTPSQREEEEKPAANVLAGGPTPELQTPAAIEASVLAPTPKLHPPELPAFDPVAEVPTLAQQTPPPSKELFELHTPGESLNDRLKREEKELAHKLVDTPIKDLRKGIGINDRYLFISELFRGDEAMYERSIKTINTFHILPEAEYWINRELKVKLGWDDGPTVRHFDQLVRRRFS